MTTGKRAHSSNDLELARTISRRLQDGVAKAQPGASLGYIRFSASRFISHSAPEAPSPFGPAIWNDLLGLAVEQSSAELAFVVDMQGLIIASVGEEEPSLVEGIGARLLIAFEQADQMTTLGGEPTESIAIQMGRRWLTGLRMRRGEDKSVIVGVLGPQAVSAETREALEELLSYA